jgi:hypothetical protein
MSWYVRQLNIRVMALPGMPIAAAQSGRFDADDDAILRGRDVDYVFDGGQYSELLDDYSAHISILSVRSYR